MIPDIYLFNPTCELAVANGSSYYMPPAQLRQFENELCTLPGILARPGDIVLVNQPISQKFIDQLECAGFDPPAFRMPDQVLSDPDFLTLEKGTLFPWGWSPAAHKLLNPIKQGCGAEFLNSPVANWHEIHRELYSRKSSHAILHRLVETKSNNNILSINDLPEICTNHDQIIKLQRKWGKVVVKAPLSSSGRGLQILRDNEYNQTNRQVISGYFKQQGYVITGPWHNKALDLSFQFFSYGNGMIEYKGLTTFTTDQAGRYTGNYIQELSADLGPELNRFLMENLLEVKKTLLQTLTASNYSTDYYGWFGVDSLIFKAPDGEFIIQPCIEINCRFTMGAIALSLRNHLAEQSNGEFRIMHGKAGSFQNYCDEMSMKDPLIVKNGKIVGGFLALTPALQNCSFGAYIKVNPDPDQA
jgi:hypothetical protein